MTQRVTRKLQNEQCYHSHQLSKTTDISYTRVTVAAAEDHGNCGIYGKTSTLLTKTPEIEFLNTNANRKQCFTF